MTQNTKHDARQNRIRIAALINEGKSVREIQRITGSSFTTISKVKKALEDPNQNVEDDRREQNGAETFYTADTRNAVLAMRMSTGHGPRLLYYLLKNNPEKYGIEASQVPSEDTIHKWLTEAKLTRKMVASKDRRGFPIDFEDKPGVIALDEWGPVMLRGERLFLVTLQDRFTKLSLAVPVFKKGSARTWIKAIDLATHNMLAGAAPTAIWIDNGVGMSLSSGFTSQPVRYALSKGTRVVFNIPHQPWRNGRLENWHWRQEVEYWSQLDANTTGRQAIAGYLAYLNYYNMERPHGGLHDLDGQKITGKAPAQLAKWYVPVDASDYIDTHAGEARLEPQKGIIDMVRSVRNNGLIELQDGETLRVSEIFGGALLRIRFYLDPDAETQIGQVIWQRGQRKTPLAVASFNHKVDRSRRKGEPLVFDVRDIDFSDTEEAPYIEGIKKVDEYQIDRAASRVGKRAKNFHTSKAAGEAPREIDPDTGEILTADTFMQALTGDE